MTVYKTAITFPEIKTPQRQHVSAYLRRIWLALPITTIRTIICLTVLSLALGVGVIIPWLMPVFIR